MAFSDATQAHRDAQLARGEAGLVGVDLVEGGLDVMALDLVGHVHQQVLGELVQLLAPARQSREQGDVE